MEGEVRLQEIVAHYEKELPDVTAYASMTAAELGQHFGVVFRNMGAMRNALAYFPGDQTATALLDLYERHHTAALTAIRAM